MTLLLQAAADGDPTDVEDILDEDDGTDADDDDAMPDLDEIDVPDADEDPAGV